MQKRNFELSIAIPASFVSEVPHLREKTIKIGLIGRAAAIFCVNEIIVFPDLPDTDQTPNTTLLATILSYMETPQYLRKHLFKMRPELRYAGILPPLGTPNHPLANKMKALVPGEHRDGVILSSRRDGSMVDIGVERLIFLPNKGMRLNARVTVKITRVGKTPSIALVRAKPIKNYWGYRVTVSDDPFGRMVTSRPFDLVVATSRYGMSIRNEVNKLAKRLKEANSVLLAFGAPTQGLYDIVTHENIELDEVAAFTINAIPNQGSRTVRTEEAVYASLAVITSLC